MLVARPRAVENIGSGIARGFPEAALNAPVRATDPQKAVNP